MPRRKILSYRLAETGRKVRPGHGLLGTLVAALCLITRFWEEPGHWLDIVQMNCWPPRHIPRHYLLFLYASGDVAYYLDTSRRDQTGECPVAVIGPDEEGVVVADSFLDFLRKAKARST